MLDLAMPLNYFLTHIYIVVKFLQEPLTVNNFIQT